MILSGYGLQLKKLTVEDIELVRKWRNDPKISQYMSYREYISKEMQLRWFNSIDNNENYFFIIEHNGEKIGLTELKRLNIEKQCAEAGLFIYSDDHLNSLVPYKISSILLEFGFFTLNLSYIYARVLKTNKRAIRFNLSLGYILEPDQDGIENQEYRLTKENYEIQAKTIKRILEKEYENE